MHVPAGPRATTWTRYATAPRWRSRLGVESPRWLPLPHTWSPARISSRASLIACTVVGSLLRSLVLNLPELLALFGASVLRPRFESLASRQSRKARRSFVRATATGGHSIRCRVGDAANRMEATSGPLRRELPPGLFSSRRPGRTRPRERVVPCHRSDLDWSASSGSAIGACWPGWTAIRPGCARSRRGGPACSCMRWPSC